MKVVLTCEVCQKDFTVEAPLSRRGGYREPECSLCIYSEIATLDEPSKDVICADCADSIIAAINAQIVKLTPIQQESPDAVAEAH